MYVLDFLINFKKERTDREWCLIIIILYYLPIQATRGIKAGDTLIVERPFAAVLLPEHYDQHCHHCFVRLQSIVP